MSEKSESKPWSLAGFLYEQYCAAVGGKAFNGDPLPSWEEFSKDPAKQLQADAWRSLEQHVTFRPAEGRDPAPMEKSGFVFLEAEEAYKAEVRNTKRFRADLDNTLQSLKGCERKSRERSIVVKKIQEAIMWLGMDLKAINEENPGSSPNPYPESYNPDSPVIEPTADGLKL